MDRSHKERVVASLKESLARAEVVVVTHYSGLNVSALNELRRSMRSAGASFRVAKNRLAQRALEGTPYGGLKTLLRGPTAIAVSADVSAAPRVVVEFSKKHERLVIVGGALGASLLDAQGVRALAALPSLDALRGKLVGLLKASPGRLVGVLAAPGGQLARLVGAYAARDEAD